MNDIYDLEKYPYLRQAPKDAVKSINKGADINESGARFLAYVIRRICFLSFLSTPPALFARLFAEVT
ncbi:hypothetical protein HNY73_005671 [Argiope bruennichi]|uniref:Uncharacterized protein n=1 Tax=Argiope bruennichi TaxID=94029 RepID=A0A8T0FHD0_ARGBR|nr:hypothetical protein HNY73_005671 [Argiope bruennichi]